MRRGILVTMFCVLLGGCVNPLYLANQQSAHQVAEIEEQLPGVQHEFSAVLANVPTEDDFVSQAQAIAASLKGRALETRELVRLENEARLRYQRQSAQFEREAQLNQAIATIFQANPTNFLPRSTTSLSAEAEQPSILWTTPNTGQGKVWLTKKESSPNGPRHIGYLLRFESSVQPSSTGENIKLYGFSYLSQCYIPQGFGVSIACGYPRRASPEQVQRALSETKEVHVAIKAPDPAWVATSALSDRFSILPAEKSSPVEQLYRIDFETAKSRLQRKLGGFQYVPEQNTFRLMREATMDSLGYRSEAYGRLAVTHIFEMALHPDRNNTVVVFRGTFESVRDYFTERNHLGQDEFNKQLALYQKQVSAILSR